MIESLCKVKTGEKIWGKDPRDDVEDCFFYRRFRRLTNGFKTKKHNIKIGAETGKPEL